MNRTPRLSRSGIEYLDYVWNFCSGCTNGCEYCWARPITHRFPDRYPNGFAPTIYPEALLSPLYLKKPSIIGCVFMGDLFDGCPEFAPDRIIGRKGLFPNGVIRAEAVGIGLPPFNKLSDVVKDVIRACPQHTFLFLTKQPQNLIKWSPFPDNCYVGVTATDAKTFLRACRGLEQIEAKVKYISLEPFLDYIGGLWAMDWFKSGTINGLIIGSLTCSGGDLATLSSKYPELMPMPYGNRYTLQPKIEWVREIVEAKDKADGKMFLKDNLKPLIDSHYPPESKIQPNHDRLLRMKHPYFCADCEGEYCRKCGVVWGLRQEMPVK